MGCVSRSAVSFLCCLFISFSMYCSVKALRFAKRTLVAPTILYRPRQVQSSLFCTQSVSTGTNPNKIKDGKSKQSAQTQPTLAIDEIKKARVVKMDQLKQLGQNPFAYTYDQTHKAAALHQLCTDLPNGQEDPDLKVSVCGRIMTRRVFGKLAFFHLQDDSGQIQLYIDKARLTDDSFEQLKTLTDAGDIIGVKGTVKRTDKGELSVSVNEWTMLTKSLHPLPDKFHGLTDISKRYRQRHLDMVVNPEVRDVFRTRAKVISSMRRILDGSGFVEIETPILNAQPGGAEAKPFETFHNSLDMPLTLRIATELHLKRMVVGGFDRVYEIGRIFRNEGLSPRHNPEFTSVELYQAYADYDDMMRLTETMVADIAKQVTGSTIVPYQGQQIDLTPPWRRVSMCDIVQETCGVDFYPFILSGDLEGARQAAVEQAKIPAEQLQSFQSPGEVLNFVFEERCESTLIQPTFITDHPVEVSPLAKPHRTRQGLVERFEMFMVGREHANAFSELTDPIDQRARFNVQAEKKARGDPEACGVDEDFLQALEVGMPPTAGLGIGVDRLVMVLTDSAAIRDVIAFPLLRKEG